MANFSTEGWTGPESSHLQGKKDYLLKFKAGEPNKDVQRWIEEYVAIIDKEIERARIREEREAY
jgi:LPS O-antigen subunit length determinant protein (WzzB/FepE family)